MTQRGIYATPNNVVANKNRKTTFDVICENINNYKEIKEPLFKQLKDDLIQYYSDIHSKYSDVDIIDVFYDDYNITIVGFTYDEYRMFYAIPKEWYINREEYLKKEKTRNISRRIAKLQKYIEECKKSIAEETSIIEKLNKRLKNLE